VALVIGGAFLAWQRLKPQGLPPSIASGNGRLEATDTDIATKTGGRVLQVLVREGDNVRAGQTLVIMDTAVLEASNPKTIKFVLKQPFPLLLEVLGKPNAPLPVMMPARLAATPADQRIAEPIGSGPFRFLKDQWRPGNAMILERNAAYVPRKEAPDFLTGGKNVKIDQLTLRVMPPLALLKHSQAVHFLPRTLPLHGPIPHTCNFGMR